MDKIKKVTGSHSAHPSKSVVHTDTVTLCVQALPDPKTHSTLTPFTHLSFTFALPVLLPFPSRT